MPREIELTNGGTFLIDDEDVRWLEGRKWCRSPQGYVVSVKYLGRENGKNINEVIALHRLILGVGPKERVDHINGIKTDNRRCNLRKADAAQNGWNSKVRVDNSSGIKGVSFHAGMGKWRARFLHRGTVIHVGTFNTKEEATTAYTKAVEQYRGEYHTNGR